METRSLKALSLRILQGNWEGNQEETESFPAWKPERQRESFHGAVEIITPEGERLWIATEHEAVNLLPEGAIYFHGEEIMQLQKAGKDTARAALSIKKVFGNDAKIEGVTFRTEKDTNAFLL